MTLDEIKNAIADLSPDDFLRLRTWFADFDAETWDRQIEEDVKAGRLDELAKSAWQEHRVDQTTEL
jgi:hypothetical protein